MTNREQGPLTMSAFMATLTECVAALISRRETLERERSRLDDWRISGGDECRFLVRGVTSLQEEIQQIHDLIDRQYGCSPSDGQWRRLLRSLHALSDPGDEAAIQITAYSTFSHLLTVEALRQRRTARTALHDLLFETKAIEEVLVRVLAEQGASVMIVEAGSLLPAPAERVAGTEEVSRDPR